jgi:hypothetical protein
MRVKNFAQSASADDGAEPEIQQRALRRRVNPPDHSVVRPQFVLGRRSCVTLALAAVNSGSLIMVAGHGFQKIDISVVRNPILAVNGPIRYPSLAEEYPLFNRLLHALSELP